MDHLYCHKAENSAYIKNSTNSDLISIIKENKQLKFMLLLHLDLIQEQSDQLVTKEKQISTLRQENESLKLKIERMERRMHLKQSRSILHTLPPVDVKTKNNGASPKPHFRMDLEPKCDTMEDIKPDLAIVNQRSLADIMAEKPPEVNGLPIGKIVLNNAGNIENITPAATQMPEIKVEAIEEHSECPVEVQPPPPVPEQPIPGPSDGILEAAELEKKPKRRLSEVSTKDQGKKAPKLTSMSTSKQYVTRDWELMDLEEELVQVIEKRGDSEINLEVPSWRIVEAEEEDDGQEKQAETVSEEEIREETYMKRHLKFEIDERRRKKWDVQRIREQRTIERLRKRHCKSDAVAGAEEKASTCPSSFYPSPNTIRFIHITDELPVQAFGELIPSVAPLEFCLPWMTSHESPHVVLGGPQEANMPVTSSIRLKLKDKNKKIKKLY